MISSVLLRFGKKNLPNLPNCQEIKVHIFWEGQKIWKECLIFIWHFTYQHKKNGWRFQIFVAISKFVCKQSYLHSVQFPVKSDTIVWLRNQTLRVWELAKKQVFDLEKFSKNCELLELGVAGELGEHFLWGLHDNLVNAV